MPTQKERPILCCHCVSNIRIMQHGSGQNLRAGICNPRKSTGWKNSRGQSRYLSYQALKPGPSTKHITGAS